MERRALGWLWLTLNYSWKEGGKEKKPTVHLYIRLNWAVALVPAITRWMQNKAACLEIWQVSEQLILNWGRCRRYLSLELPPVLSSSLERREEICTPVVKWWEQWVMISSFTPLLGLPLPLLSRQFIQLSSVVFTVGSLAGCAWFVSMFMCRFYIIHWQNSTDEIYRERKGQVIMVYDSYSWTIFYWIKRGLILQVCWLLVCSRAM